MHLMLTLLCTLCIGGQETAVALHVLQQSLQPLLASLQAWLYEGLLPASPHNFFIFEGGWGGPQSDHEPV